MNTLELRRCLRSWVASGRMHELGADPCDATASVRDFGTVTLAAAVGAHHCGGSDSLAGNEVSLSAVECALADYLGLGRATAAHLRMTDHDLQFVVEWNDRDRPREFLLPDPLFGGYVEGTPRRETVLFAPVTASLGRDHPTPTDSRLELCDAVAGRRPPAAAARRHVLGQPEIGAYRDGAIARFARAFTVPPLRRRFGCDRDLGSVRARS